MGTKMGQQIRYWIPAQDSTLGGAAPFLKLKNHLVDIFEKNQNDDKNTESMRRRRTCLSKSKGRPKPPVKPDTYQKLYR